MHASIPRLISVFTGLLLPATLAVADTASADADDLVRAGLAAEEQFDTATALDLFIQADQVRPDDDFILQKIARQYSDSIVDLPEGDVTEAKRRATLALDYARRSVALNPKSAENVLSLAVCHGKLATYSDTRTKINFSRLVKEDAERALELDPDYDWAHHLLGRWHYEIATLGGTTRFVVRIIYGGLPNASLAKAVEHLERAVSLAPEVAPHQLELGFAYLASENLSKARAAFERGLALPSTGKHDEAAKTRAREALARLN